MMTTTQTTRAPQQTVYVLQHWAWGWNDSEVFATHAEAMSRMREMTWRDRDEMRVVARRAV